MTADQRATPVWLLLAAAALAVVFVVLVVGSRSFYPLAHEADAYGRMNEFSSWMHGGPPPALSRGPLHFYLMRLDSFLFWTDDLWFSLEYLCAGLFLLFYCLFVARVVNPWVAVGSANGWGSSVFSARARTRTRP